MKPILIHDKRELETFLLRRAYLYFYHLGDLDDFFWPYTTWFGVRGEDGELAAVNLLYSGLDPAAFLALTAAEDRGEAEALLKSSASLLPRKFYSHITPGLEAVLEGQGYSLDLHGLHYKMALTELERLEAVDTESVEQMEMENLAEMETLYAEAYPGNWFDPRMLETGMYTGVRDEGGALIAVAGIHVYSPEYKIAALGNITVHAERRGEGIGKAVTAGLCKLLLETVDTIGLNVKADNAAAIRAYEKIGFEVAAEYNEWMVTCVEERKK